MWFTHRQLVPRAFSLCEIWPWDVRERNTVEIVIMHSAQLKVVAVGAKNGWPTTIKALQ